MSDTKHTKKPWRFRFDPSNQNGLVVGKDREVVATVWGENGGAAKANGCLIAGPCCSSKVNQDFAKLA